MRTEQNRSTDGIIAFPRSQEIAESASARGALPDTEVSPATVLNAERGIINTGTVHGGQHLTAIALSGHFDGGADEGI